MSKFKIFLRVSFQIKYYLANDTKIIAFGSKPKEQRRLFMNTVFMRAKYNMSNGRSFQ